MAQHAAAGSSRSHRSSPSNARSIRPAKPRLLCTTRRNRLHSIGVSVTDTTPEIRIAVVIVTANSRNSRPSIPLMNRIGMNTAASDVVIVRIVKPISREPLSAASSGAFAVLHVPHDVLEHHDRVVDDEADREDERHHRQVVQAEVQHLHDGERAEDRERQRQRRNERGRAVVQEQVDHADDEDQRHQHRRPGCR